MRKIKFRALKDDMSNCNWVYGSLIYNERNEPMIQTDIKSMILTTCLKGTEGQFTEWSDSKINTYYPNGQPIYEGDIVRDKNGAICFVIWEDGGFAVKSPGSEAVDWEHGSWYANTEVIGNIHENPEILNK